jgi:S1-C subfamily serine protease
VSGVIIREVYKSSPVAQAGLRSMVVDRRGTVTSYDVILAIGDDEVNDFDDLYRALDGRQPGDQITLHYQRDGKRQETTLQLQEID